MRGVRFPIVPRTAFVAYIDESGDEGWRFGSGSSEWFVLSAVVFLKETELQEVKLVDAVRAKMNAVRQPGSRFLPEKKPLHFRDLRHEQKRFFVGQIARANLWTLTVAVHKPSLADRHPYRLAPGLYFTCARSLVERIARFAEASSSGGCAVDLCFSNRATMDYESLKSHLALQAEWPSVFAPDAVTVYTPGQRMGLQIADAVASGYFLALEPNPYGDTEDAYVRALRPKAATVEEEVWGVGVTVIPEAAVERARGGLLSPRF